jgi:hypothetical protein
MPTRRHILAAAGSAAFLAAMPRAFAHHGWSWTGSGFFQLEGRVAAIYFGNPHPILDVDVEGEVWRVELAPPGATAAAGFTETTAKAGDEIVAIGNRSQDPAERRMKAVRLITGGKTYDVYPRRAADI